MFLDRKSCLTFMYFTCFKTLCKLYVWEVSPQSKKKKYFFTNSRLLSNNYGRFHFFFFLHVFFSFLKSTIIGKNNRMRKYSKISFFLILFFPYLKTNFNNFDQILFFFFFNIWEKFEIYKFENLYYFNWKVLEYFH